MTNGIENRFDDLSLRLEESEGKTWEGVKEIPKGRINPYFGVPVGAVYYPDSRFDQAICFDCGYNGRRDIHVINLSGLSSLLQEGYLATEEESKHMDWERLATGGHD